MWKKIDIGSDVLTIIMIGYLVFTIFSGKLGCDFSFDSTLTVLVGGTAGLSVKSSVVGIWKRINLG